MKTECVLLTEIIHGEWRILQYDPSMHGPRCQFLYLKNEEVEVLIVTNNAVNQFYLLESYFFRENPDCRIFPADLCGLGRTYGEEVEIWHNPELDVRTPEVLRPRISELLFGTKEVK